MSKPVIFIPGYPGSHLKTTEGKRIFLSLLKLLKPTQKFLQQLEGPDDLGEDDGIVAGDPVERLAKILLFDLAKQAKSLYEILAKLGIDPEKFGYDWRRPVWDVGTQARLKAVVKTLNPGSGPKIVAIVHSTGGLVLRYFLEQNPTLAARFERVIAFGVPWAGLLKSLQFLDARLKFATLTKKQAQRVVAHSWAGFDLLPPDPARTQMLDAEGNPLNLVVDGAGKQTSPLVKEGWFPQELKSAMKLRAGQTDSMLGARGPELQLGGRKLPVTNVVGWGAETTVQATISGSGANQKISRWEHITEPGALDGGDATAPFRSASWLRGADVSRYHLPVGYHRGAKKFSHSSLWRNPGGRNLLAHFLTGKKLKPFVYSAVDKTDFERKGRSPVKVRISALDATGRPLSGVRIRAIDLTSGSGKPRTTDLGDGRHKIALPRARMRHIHGKRFRRTTLKIDWDGGSVNRVVVVNEQGG